jgi:hypothetical protein
MTKRQPAKLRRAENIERICRLIAEGNSLRQVARELQIESAGSITDWVREDAEFAVHYARAMELRCERMAEEILEIADDSSNDWMAREGRTVPDHENVQRSRLRVDSRRWLLSKMMPKRYGDRVEITGDANAPLIQRIELVAVRPKQQEEPSTLDGSDEATVMPLRALPSR